VEFMKRYLERSLDDYWMLITGIKARKVELETLPVGPKGATCLS